jgi:hypothetical protein
MYISLVVILAFRFGNNNYLCLLLNCKMNNYGIIFLVNVQWKKFLFVYGEGRWKPLADDGGCKEDRSVIWEYGGRDINGSVTENLYFTQDDIK